MKIEGHLWEVEKMQPKDPLLDVMKRTMYNLSYIENQANNEGPFEVTQLINSFLGALAHPWEKYRGELKEVSLEKAQAKGCPVVDKDEQEDADPTNLGDLLRRMRNGIAHGNIRFNPDDKGDIETVSIWNYEHGTCKREWGATISVNIMRTFLFKFVELAEQLHGKQR